MNARAIDTTVGEGSSQDVPKRELKRVVGDLWGHTELLVRQEIALLRLTYEIRVKAGKALLLRGATAAVLFYAVFLTTLAALVLVLAQWVPAWISALAVGVVAGLGALASRHLAKRALKARSRN